MKFGIENAIFSSFSPFRSQPSREFGTAAASRSFFENLFFWPTSIDIRKDNDRVYESTYKSRIVRLPMFSRPDINPTVKRSCTRYCSMADPSRNRMTPDYLFIKLRAFGPLVTDFIRCDKIQNSCKLSWK